MNDDEWKKSAGHDRRSGRVVNGGTASRVLAAAGQIAAATGKQFAVVLMSGTDPDYADVIPELILEDALRVVPYGWPVGI